MKNDRFAEDCRGRSVVLRTYIEQIKGSELTFFFQVLESVQEQSSHIKAIGLTHSYSTGKNQRHQPLGFPKHLL